MRVLQTAAQPFDLSERQFLAVSCEIQNFLPRIFFVLSHIFKPPSLIFLNMSLVTGLKCL